NGVYAPALQQAVQWLAKAREVADNPAQAKNIDLLISYFTTGNLTTWDEFNVAWVKDVKSVFDYILGFIESYNDPLGRKAAFEGIIELQDLKASHRTEVLAANAKWFEDNSPIDPKYKRDEVVGVTAKVVNVVQVSGDSYPAAPLGVNLPNSNWIRKVHGSKSVSLENIALARHQASLTSGVWEEFYLSTEVEQIKKNLWAADNLHTDLHEAIGHASGKLAPGVGSEALKNYGGVIEETRAELNALYFMADPKIIELGLLPDSEAYKAEYVYYIRNGLMVQMSRLNPGKNLEQTHMRGRQLISAWAQELGKANNTIEKKSIDGKTYFVINDFAKLREIFGTQLKEIQRIKSEGKFDDARDLIEKYGVQVNQDIHKEVLARYQKLGIPPYAGFINPNLTPVFGGKGKIINIKISYPRQYERQMLDYGKKYSFL
ncbi:MAG: dihydrofolate reductase, partial [Pseudomonadota bacterium]